jgi:amino acid transporter
LGSVHNKSALSWLVGAGIVGADIGTSVFYSTGILFPIVGYLAPLFILIVCGMMWLFKATYEEGLAISPYNGGAYVMILRSVGRRAAVAAGALTAVSYLATAAVSALAGAYYLSSMFSHSLSTPVITLISFFPLVLFGLLNTRGIKEPAKLVTIVAAIHFALLIIMGVWGLGYLIFNDVDFTKMAKIVPGELTAAAIIHGFAAAFLGITGFESAAQIVEELEEPVMPTVRKLYQTVVVLVSLTAPLISFLCLAILTEEEILGNKEFLLSGLANQLGGVGLLTVIVIDATLTLFAATNTAFVGFIGLATTMAKQGNLPQVLLRRVAHKYPTIQGYPMIALPFMLIAILMTLIVPGRVEVLAEVYGMAFLGVMVSFALGVVLMRNRPLRRDCPTRYLTQLLLNAKGRIIPMIPLISGVVLIVAQLILVLSAPLEAQSMLIWLLSTSVLIMAFYRWGVLETRLETRHDLRLGLGKFAHAVDLPTSLPTFVLCTGGTGARRLINAALRYAIRRSDGEPFELVIFHAEEDKDPQGFFYSLIQRVVSQQIAPIYINRDGIITVKILPGSFAEGLQTLKKSVNFQTLLIGPSRHETSTQDIVEALSEELEIEVVALGGESASVDKVNFANPS